MYTHSAWAAVTSMITCSPCALTVIGSYTRCKGCSVDTVKQFGALVALLLFLGAWFLIANMAFDVLGIF
jgi:hypothetical protein